MHNVIQYGCTTPGENFSPISPLALSGKNLSCVHDYMATFTTLAKFIPPNISVIQMQAKFCPVKIFGYMVLALYGPTIDVHIGGNGTDGHVIRHELINIPKPISTKI